MNKAKKYAKMVIYWESCRSGSMFQPLNDSPNVYAVSAASPFEIQLHVPTMKLWEHVFSTVMEGPGWKVSSFGSIGGILNTS